MMIKRVFIFSLGCCLLASVAQAQVSVALSDNLLILDSQTRSSMFELVNLASEPTEFRLETDKLLLGTKEDASKIIRWAPARSLVPANRTVPVRVSARPTPELAAGEYIFRVGVTAEVKPVPQRPRPGEVEAPPDGIVVTIPLVPTLPVTVYLRHHIEAPMIDVEPLVLTPDDPEMMGYFPVKKRNPAHSFVGQVLVFEKTTGQRINSGRLHLRQGGGAGSRVSMPRGKTPLQVGAQYCLQVWDHFPGKGEPALVVCGS